MLGVLAIGLHFLIRGPAVAVATVAAAVLLATAGLVGSTPRVAAA